jgi:4-amino-4-deoxy-L-arabinose transferase-like glycosyltransferase
MALYAVFGHMPLLPKLINGAMAALCAVLIFEIARRAFRPSVAVLAGVGAALMPSLILWSVVTLKESLVLLLAVLGLWALQRLAEQPSPRRAANVLMVLLATMLVSIDLRSTTSLILLVLVPIVLLGRGHFRPRAWQLGLLGLAVLVVLGGGLFVARGRISNRPPAGVLEDVVLQIRHRRAQEAASARSQIRPQSEVISAEGRPEVPEAEAVSDATPFSFGSDVLEPLGFALLAPAPWQAKNLSELAVSAEMLAWYVLLGASFCAWRAPPRQRLFVACLVAYGLANWLVLAASEGNLGNLMRHRILLAPTLLVLGAAGLEWLWARAGKPRPAGRHLPGLQLEARVES